MSFMVGGAIVGGSLISGYMGNKAAGKAADASQAGADASIAEQRRQFDLQRSDSEPWRKEGVNALNTMTGNLRSGDYDPTQFSYDSSMPGGTPLPEFGGRDRFNFDLEGDAGYIFARDEGIKAANREGAAGGKYGSGNRLAEISDRVTGLASTYANDAYNRQMGTSRENYGRGVNEYGLDYGRNTDMYGREVNKEASDYSRSLTQHGLDTDRESNIYGQNQNWLNRLAAISNTGQTANMSSAASGSNMANAVGNINMANASNQGNSSYNRYGAINNAVQGGIGNYFAWQNSMAPAGGTGYGGNNVPGDAYQPSQNYYGR